MANRTAREGWVFVCLACGKTSRDRYGDAALSRGWDVSCMLNSEELEITRLVYNADRTRVVEVR